ncbi:ATPase, T2SS/T4P/T4SS family [Coxiella-like endosymbiont]|uniref:ATPase, T2SS/T4P/T4SS family n=1 Tax=Coxiella-like endosymbiont TaxID=1592897 RepID=UPI00272B945C|nr:ATPase, T2SS/T4P/T4SS family [Coxiella-like endosymbiont]
MSSNLTRDCRLISCPTVSREKIFICLLNPVHHLLNLEELGLDERLQQLFIKKIEQPQSSILITGPTREARKQFRFTQLLTTLIPFKKIFLP